MVEYGLWLRGRGLSGYLLNTGSWGLAKTLVREPVGLLVIRLPAVVSVWLESGLRTHRFPSGVEWLKRGLRRPK